MSDLGNKAIMAQNIQRLMQRFGKSRVQICDDLGIRYTTFADWVKGRTYPRIDKIELMANYFGVTKSDLVESHEADNSVDYISNHPRKRTAKQKKQAPEASIVESFQESADRYAKLREYDESIRFKLPGADKIQKTLLYYFGWVLKQYDADVIETMATVEFSSMHGARKLFRVPIDLLLDQDDEAGQLFEILKCMPEKNKSDIQTKLKYFCMIANEESVRKVLVYVSDLLESPKNHQHLGPH